ncbi:MAG: substrate-binding domain-containing protein [Acutalibacteraceae bacterium]|nr:substrate-binding domain-containing protein [Acutalibacteraceae bacterium]
MKKLLSLILAAGMLTAALTGCGAQTSSDATGGGVNDSISVLTREEGSGTRGAFIELFGIEQKDADGKKVDHTITSAESTNSTSVMMTTVQGNKSAIGYVSLGSLDETKVKALKVDGSAATAENVKSGEYKVSRPFNVATKGDATGVAGDFLKFILSEQGQKVVEDNGYISEGNNGAYTASNQSGKITVGGSSSVTPVMEKLKEAYVKLNPNVTVDVQQSDSTSGMTNTIDGVYDIGMASRELKDSEKEAGLVPTVIALDGIAVIVNKDNAVEDITSEQILKIYTGEITLWSEVK